MIGDVDYQDYNSKKTQLGNYFNFVPYKQSQ